jgi:hypothetical protein
MNLIYKMYIRKNAAVRPAVISFAAVLIKDAD